MSKILQSLEKWLKKQAEDKSSLDDRSQGDPKARTKGRIIEVEGNIDYDLENGFWLARLRQRQKLTDETSEKTSTE